MNLLRKTTCMALLAGSALAPQAQILYKVEAPKSDKTSYILGTHHFAPLAVADSLPGLPEIITGADCVIGEVDMSKMMDTASLMAMQQSMMAPADSTLDKVLSPAQLDSVGAVFSDLAGQQVPVQALTPLKPAALSTQMAQLITMRYLPHLNPMEGIDNTMQTRAREAGKPVEGFETMEFQTDMLFGLPIQYQADALMETVRDIEAEGAQARKLSEAYIAHDIDTILRVMLETEEKDPAMAERMLYSRNADWVAKMTPRIPSESLFVVVGAGHLPGPRGVLEGLRKQGFKVTAVK